MRYLGVKRRLWDTKHATILQDISLFAFVPSAKLDKVLPEVFPRRTVPVVKNRLRGARKGRYG